MKTKIWKFSPTIYPIELLVCKSPSEEELKKRFMVIMNKREVKEPDDEFRPDGMRLADLVPVVDRTTGKAYGLIIIYRPNEISFGTLAHEALHFCTYLSELLGFKAIELENDEPYAYLIEWVTNCINSVRANTPQKMSGELFE